MMRFINVSRKKDALILVGSILLIVLALGVQVVLGRTAGGGVPETNTAAVMKFFTSPDSILNRIGAFFPPGIWATKAVAGGFTGQGLGNLALLWAVSLGLFVGMVGLAEMLFYRGVVGLGETTGKKRRLTRDEMARRVTSGRRAMAAVFGREWKFMNRTPIFLLNGTLVVVLFPGMYVRRCSRGSLRPKQSANRLRNRVKRVPKQEISVASMPEVLRMRESARLHRPARHDYVSLCGAVVVVVPEKLSGACYSLEERRRDGGYTLQETRGVRVRTLQNRNGFHAAQAPTPRRVRAVSESFRSVAQPRA